MDAEKRQRIEEEGNRCEAFWEKLVDYMSGKGYVVKASDSGTNARYCLEEGQEDQVSWMQKPKKSFRIASFWSWFANMETCLAPRNYIQCWNVDFGYVKPRWNPTSGTLAKQGWAVAYTEDGYHYHTIYGRRKNPFTKKWEFYAPDFDKIIKELSF